MDLYNRNVALTILVFFDEVHVGWVVVVGLVATTTALAGGPKPPRQVLERKL